MRATVFADKPENRKGVAEMISPANYLNQPPIVVEQVLTGRFADGLGKVRNVPDRIGFDPFPWHSMAVWIMTQMKRWGYIDGDVNYRAIAEQVYLAADCGKVMKELGYEPPAKTYANYTIMGKEFDYTKPDEYAKSFAITRA
jgi:nitrate/nitrite transport system substrate-binding protein